MQPKQEILEMVGLELINIPGMTKSILTATISEAVDRIAEAE